jgi:hypothetical protein
MPHGCTEVVTIRPRPRTPRAGSAAVRPAGMVLVIGMGLRVAFAPHHLSVAAYSVMGVVMLGLLASIVWYRARIRRAARIDVTDETWAFHHPSRRRSFSVATESARIALCCISLKGRPWRLAVLYGAGANLGVDRPPRSAALPRGDWLVDEVTALAESRGVPVEGSFEDAMSAQEFWARFPHSVSWILIHPTIYALLLGTGAMVIVVVIVLLFGGSY